jgi:hypothetical protein
MTKTTAFSVWSLVIGHWSLVIWVLHFRSDPLLVHNREMEVGNRTGGLDRRMIVTNESRSQWPLAEYRQPMAEVVP